MEIQKAAERKMSAPTAAEDIAAREQKAQNEKNEKKNVISLSRLKEMEEAAAAKSGKKKKAGGGAAAGDNKKKKKKKKKMVNLKVEDGIDAVEIQEAKAKIFRESKKEKTVLGKRYKGTSKSINVNNRDKHIECKQISEVGKGR